MALPARGVGLGIALLGTLGVTPDAALLRLMEALGGVTAIITVWRFVIVGVMNTLLAALLQGGVGHLVDGLRTAPCELFVGAAILAVTNVGFVVSLLRVDPAKALLLISLNPLWASVLGYVCLGDAVLPRTALALALSVVCMSIVFVPNLCEIFGWTLDLPWGLAIGPHMHADTGAAEGGDGVLARSSWWAIDLHTKQQATSELLDLVPLVTGVAIAAFLVFSRYCSKRGISDASMEAAPPLASLLTALVAIALAKEQGVRSLTEGLQPPFWGALVLDGLCIAGYNAALVLAPRYISAAEVALILLGETLIGPLWVYWGFGVVPSAWTLLGGGLLMFTLVGHEVAGFGVAEADVEALSLKKAPEEVQPDLLDRLTASAKKARRASISAVTEEDDAGYRYQSMGGEA